MQEMEFPFETPPITIRQLLLAFLIAFGLTGFVGVIISKTYSDIFTSIALFSSLILIFTELYINSLRTKLSKYFKDEFNEEDFDSGVENLLKNL